MADTKLVIVLMILDGFIEVDGGCSGILVVTFGELDAISESTKGQCRFTQLL